ncbi:MAG: hypothetical protein ACTHNU_08415 [Gaiellales bacterium]
MEVVGALCGLGAATLFGCGIVIQAGEARLQPRSHAMRLSLLVHLARSLRWLAGTALTVAGWGLQAIAFALAPVTIVQPALAFTLVVVLAGAHRRLQEPVGRREIAAVAALCGAMVVLVLVAPSHTSAHAHGVRLGVTVAVLLVVGLGPFLFASAVRDRPGLAATAAGVAFALAGIATKLFTDTVSESTLTGVGWLAVVAAISVAGGVAEMTSFQTGRAGRVAPITFAFEIVLPVIVAPALFDERWSGMGAFQLVLLVLALLTILAAVVTLARSSGVAQLVAARAQE